MDEMVVKLEPERILDIASDEDFDEMVDGSEGSLAVLKDVAVLSCKQVSWTPRRLERLSTGLNSMTQLLSLTMDGFKVNKRDVTDKSPCSDYAIGESGMETIAAGLQPLTGIQELRIRRQCLTDNDVQVLGAMAPNWTNLQVLDLSGNAFGVAGLEQLPLNEMHCLKVLNLSRNDFDHAGIECLARKLAVMRGLEELYLGWCSIGDRGAEMLSESLGNLGNLKVLEMQDNEIEYQGAASLAPALGMMIQLQKLDLSRNEIEKSGASIAFVLENLIAFQTLQRFRDAEGTQLNVDDDFNEILDAVASVVEKHTLNLSSWGLHDADMSVLVPFLDKLDTLEELNLCQNKLGENSTPILQQLVSSMPHLTLRVSSNVQRFLVLPTQTRDGFLDRRYDIVWALVATKLQRLGGGLSPLAKARKELEDVGRWCLKDFISTLVIEGDQELEYISQISYESKSITQLRVRAVHWNRKHLNILESLLSQFPPLDVLELKGVEKKDYRDRIVIDEQYRIGVAELEVLTKHASKLSYLKELSLRASLIYPGATTLLPLLFQMKYLRVLNLRLCEIGADGAKSLAPALQVMTRLQELNLYDNRIEAEGAAALAPALGMMTQLQKLWLGRNYIGAEGARVLAPALQVMTQLELLNLCNNGMGDGGAIALAPALQMMTQLKELNHGCNYIGAEGAAALALALGRMTQLQELDLDSNQIGDEGAAALAPALGKLTQLKVLNLSYNRIGDEGARVLASALQVMTQLELLNLCNNGMGDGGVITLAPALQLMTQLELLNLGGNDIRDGGARALAPALQVMTHLKVLNLGKNSIRAKGARALAPGLRKMTQLKSLNLYNSHIGDEGTRAIAPALRRMTKLEYLNIWKSSVTDEGVVALAPALQVMTRLGYLNLAYNDIGRRGFRALGPVHNAFHRRGGCFRML
jgi:Ran GTPase-activating protein (RanGAP) involved in mRNA processing and transport